MAYEIQDKLWDTSHFGFKVGEYKVGGGLINLNDLRDKAKKRNYRLVYVRSPHRLEGFEKAFCDEKIEYAIARHTSNAEDTSGVSEYSEVEVCPQLLSLALISGKYSRYNLDSQFPKEKFEELYKAWIKNSVSHEFATGVLVYKEKDEILGMLTYKHDKGRSSVGLIAVASKAQGKGIGTKMLKYLEDITPLTNILTIDTQGVNLPARRFYEKNGGTIKSITYLYHLWT